MSIDNNIRLFIGSYINLPFFKDNYSNFQNEFDGVTFGKWVEGENLHFTYFFIGDFPSFKLNQLTETISKITCLHRSELTFKGLDCFPNKYNPRVLNVPIYDPNGILKKIYTEICNEMKKFSIKSDNHSFKPHLTLQRIKEIDKSRFNLQFDKFRNFNFGSVEEFKVDLISSELTRSGPIY